jgi:hypothetical protein
MKVLGVEQPHLDLTPYWQARFAAADSVERQWILERYRTDPIERELDGLGVPRGPAQSVRLIDLWTAIGPACAPRDIGRNTFYRYLRWAGYGEDGRGFVRGLGLPSDFPKRAV